MRELASTDAILLTHLADALAEQIVARGGEVRCGQTVTSIELDSGGHACAVLARDADGAGYRVGPAEDSSAEFTQLVEGENAPGMVD